MRDTTLTGLEQVEEFPARMRPARQFDTRFDQALMLGIRTGGRKQGFIASVAIDQQMGLANPPGNCCACRPLRPA
jgi:hypothetical protein